jgi:D-alanyl-D-alanine dipeptidase
MTLIKFESIPIKESNEPLLDLQQNGFEIEPMYFKQGLSSDNKLFLRKGVVEKLFEVQKELSPLRFKIWDAFRSREAQGNIYKKYFNELKTANPNWDNKKIIKETGNFVTKPDDLNRIPPHATGGAVDLTLIDEQGNELDMGTAFDYFGPEAGQLYFEENDINSNICSNRKLLREAMLKHGFRADQDEWWHFDCGNQLWAHDLKKTYAIYGEAKL